MFMQLSKNYSKQNSYTVPKHSKRNADRTLLVRRSLRDAFFDRRNFAQSGWKKKKIQTPPIKQPTRTCSTCNPLHRFLFVQYTRRIFSLSAHFVICTPLYLKNTEGTLNKHTIPLFLQHPRVVRAFACSSTQRRGAFFFCFYSISRAAVPVTEYIGHYTERTTTTIKKKGYDIVKTVYGNTHVIQVWLGTYNYDGSYRHGAACVCIYYTYWCSVGRWWFWTIGPKLTHPPRGINVVVCRRRLLAGTKNSDDRKPPKKRNESSFLVCPRGRTTWIRQYRFECSRVSTYTR